MSKIKPYLTGTVIGAVLAYVALQFHVVHSKDGFYLVPRANQAAVSQAWVDVRDWSATDWAENPGLVQALHENGSDDIIGDSITDNVLESAGDRMAPFLGEPHDTLSNENDEGSDPIRSFLDGGFGASDREPPDDADVPLPPIADRNDRNGLARNEMFESERVPRPSTRSEQLAGYSRDGESANVPRENPDVARALSGSNVDGSLDDTRGDTLDDNSREERTDAWGQPADGLVNELANDARTRFRRTYDSAADQLEQRTNRLGDRLLSSPIPGLGDTSAASVLDAGDFSVVDDDEDDVSWLGGSTSEDEELPEFEPF